MHGCTVEPRTWLPFPTLVSRCFAPDFEYWSRDTTLLRVKLPRWRTHRRKLRESQNGKFSNKKCEISGSFSTAKRKERLWVEMAKVGVRKWIFLRQIWIGIRGCRLSNNTGKQLVSVNVARTRLTQFNYFKMSQIFVLLCFSKDRCLLLDLLWLFGGFFCCDVVSVSRYCTRAGEGTEVNTILSR